MRTFTMDTRTYVLGPVAYDTLDDALTLLEWKARSCVPPKGAQNAGKRALELIKQGKAGSNFTPVGRARAAQLARGSTLSEQTVRRMYSYFSRHVNDRKPDWGKPGQETPGYVAWLAWGGDAGARWSRAQVERWNREDSKGLSGLTFDGSPIRSITDLAVHLGTDEKMAAMHVRDLPESSVSLRVESKDVWAGNGAAPMTIGVGTVLQQGLLVDRAERYARRARKRRRKRRRPIEVTFAR